MTVFDYKNNAAAVTTTVSLTAIATSVLVDDAAQFTPAAGKVVIATISNIAETLFEIVYITAVSGSLLTITRGQDGTTGLVWPSGSRIQARITAGMLEALDPIHDIYGTVAIGESASAVGASSLAVGASATATGGSAVVVGKSAEAQGSASYSVVIGESAVSNAQYGVAIGKSASVDNLSIRSVAEGAQVSLTNSENAVAIGSQATLSAATDSVVIGKSAGATGVRTVVIGKDASSAAQRAIAVGWDADIASSADNSIAIGYSSSVGSGATYGVAIGENAAVDASKLYATAVGAGTEGSGSYSGAFGMFAKAKADYSLAMLQAEAWAGGTIAIGAVPCVQRENQFFWHQGMPNWLSTYPSILSSPPVDLAAGQVWSTSVFQDNSVVFPTAPSGNEQFYLVHSDGTYSTAWNANNTVTEAGSQPAWDITDQGDATPAAVGGGHVWVYTNPMAGIDIAVGDATGDGAGNILFFPQKVGFICNKYVANTAKPFVSVGNQSSATAYINNQQLTGITADNTVHWFPELTSVAGASNIIFTLVTKGTGASSRCQGRFVIQGVYLQLPG